MGKALLKEDWEKAKNHLQEIKTLYASIGPAGNMGLVFSIIPLEKRFYTGERTPELFASIMSLE